MTGQQIIAYEALLNWEMLGDLPDQQQFYAACEELNEHEGLVTRYRKFIEECQHNENCRHSLPNHSESLSEENGQMLSDD